MNKNDLIKVGKGAIIAGLGAALTYVSQWTTGVSFGDMTPVVTAVLAVLVNMVRKAGNAQMQKGS